MALLLGMASVFAAEVDAAGLQAIIDDPEDLEIRNVRIVEETIEDDGRYKVAVTADIANLDEGTWAATILLEESENPSFSFEVEGNNGNRIFYDSILPSQTVVGPENAVAYVPADEIEAFRTAVLAGDFFSLEGVEFYIFNTPVIPATSFMDASILTDTSDELVFNLETSGDLVGLPVSQEEAESWEGKILIEDPSQYVMSRDTRPPWDARLLNQIPFLITSVDYDEAGKKLTLSGGVVEVSSYMESGTIFVDDFSDAIDPPGSIYEPVDGATMNESIAAFLLESEGTYRMGAIPAVVDDLMIAENISLSGQTTLQHGGLKLKLKVRGLSLKSATVEMKMGLGSTLLLETLAAEVDNTLSLDEEKESEIANIPLPPLPINIGGVPINIVPSIHLYVGAEVSATSRVSIPLQLETGQTITLGWSSADGPIASSEFEFTPQVSSTPDVFGNSEISARVFGRAELEIRFEHVLGPQIGVGPYIGIEAGGTFTMDPSGDPWWNMDTEAKLYHGFLVQLFGWNIAEKRWDLDSSPLATKDSGGPAPDFPADFLDGLRSLTAPNTRWMSHFYNNPTRGGIEGAEIIYRSEADEIYAMLDYGSSSSLAKILPNGKLDWNKNFHWSKIPVAAKATPDGGITVVGKNNGGLFIAHYDLDGEYLWGHGWTTEHSNTPAELLIDENPETGELEYVIIGSLRDGDALADDPMLIRLDKAGEVIWSKTYKDGEEDEFYGGTISRAGDIVAVGFFKSDEEGVGFFQNTSNPMVMVLDRDGTPLWTAAIGTSSSGTLKDVVEGEDDTFYAAGTIRGGIAGGTIRFPRHRDYPTSTVLKFNRHSTGMDFFGLAYPGGNNLGSPWDESESITWTPNGPVVCGIKGFDSDTRGWVAAFNPSLIPNWMIEYSGPYRFAFLDIQDTSDGMLVLGDINGGKNSEENGGVAIYHLPYDGHVSYGPGYENRFSNSYLSPIFLTLPPKNSEKPLELIDGEPTIITSEFTPSNFPIEKYETSSPLTENLESSIRLVDEFAKYKIENYSEWIAYHQFHPFVLSPSQDLDGDGLSLGLEYLTGGEPYLSDLSPLSIHVEDSNAILEFPLASYVDLSEVLVERSQEIEEWFAENVTLTEINDEEGRRVRAETPIPENGSVFLTVEKQREQSVGFWGWVNSPMTKALGTKRRLRCVVPHEMGVR